MLKNIIYIILILNSFFIVLDFFHLFFTIDLVMIFVSLFSIFFLKYILSNVINNIYFSAIYFFYLKYIFILHFIKNKYINIIKMDLFLFKLNYFFFFLLKKRNNNLNLLTI